MWRPPEDFTDKVIQWTRTVWKHGEQRDKGPK